MALPAAARGWRPSRASGHQPVCRRVACRQRPRARARTSRPGGGCAVACCCAQHHRGLVSRAPSALSPGRVAHPRYPAFACPARAARSGEASLAPLWAAEARAQLRLRWVPSGTWRGASWTMGLGMNQANPPPSGARNARFCSRAVECWTRRLWLKCQKPTGAAAVVMMLRSTVGLPALDDRMLARRRPPPPRAL